MSTTYQKCPDDVAELARQIMSQNECYNDLIESRLTIDYLFALNDEGWPIKSKGRRVYGQARKTSLKERAAGRADAEILLDGNWWLNENGDKKTNQSMRKALLDHELYHIVASPMMRDDLGRPEVWMREHDCQIGWFSAVAARHGKWSMERIQLRELMESGVGQILFPRQLVLELAEAAATED